MKNLRTVAVLLTPLLAVHSPIAAPHESPELKQRVARLEATVEELTFKLSEALEQRNKLRAAMSQALQAKQKGTKVVAGCNTTSLNKSIAYSDYPTLTLEAWLESHANKCALPQLKFVKSNFSNYMTGNSSRMLNYEISIR
jgi:hypothetical protein